VNDLRTWFRERPEPATDLAVWLGLFVAALLLLGTGTPPAPIVASLLVVLVVLAVSLRWRSGPLAIAALLVIGLWLRSAAVGGGWSDVMVVTQAAVRTAIAGGNPYGIGYPESIPPGAPYAYGPVSLVWYALSVDQPGRLELLSSFVVLGLLAARGRVLGLAVYAVLPALLVTTTDGSNDTSAGLFLLGALLIAERRPVAGGFALAIAAAFKPYALAWLPGLLALGGIGMPLLAFLLGSAVAWGPAVVLWRAGPILDSLQRADSLHVTPYYSLAWVMGGTQVLPEAAWGLLRYILGAAVAATGWLVVRNCRSFVVVGCLVFLVTLFGGWWSTFAYVAAIAPIVCWHLDDWLGLGDQRASWPGDPVGAFAGWVDSRWPVVSSAA
jgi:hypothetical protein